MSLRLKFDIEKALEVILYIANSVNDTYRALKVLYFADKEHLYKYGRLICDDSYVAMSHGPVPSGCYDIIKYVRGNGPCLTDYPIEKILSAEGNKIIPYRKANLEYLSESDIECLDRSIEKYGHLSFNELRLLSQDKAFDSADPNGFISLEALAKSLPDGEQLVDYIKNG